MVLDVAIVVPVRVDHAAFHLHVEFIELQSEGVCAPLPDRSEALERAGVDAGLQLGALPTPGDDDWPRLKVGVLHRQLLELWPDRLLSLVAVQELGETLDQAQGLPGRALLA